MGYVARLADGRLIAVHGECRPREKWDDASIAQPVFGRFSSDGGKTWVVTFDGKYVRQKQ